MDHLWKYNTENERCYELWSPLIMSIICQEECKHLLNIFKNVRNFT